MAISKDKKQQLVADLNTLLSNAKMTVFAKYQGLTVAELQELRKLARENKVQIKVVKNRLVKVAMNEIAVYKDTDTTNLTGQLLYAISDTDEVMPAKTLAEFAKKHKALEISGAFNGEGISMTDAETKALATLPTKNELIASVVMQLLSPITASVSGLTGAMPDILSGLEAKVSAK